MNPSLAVAEEEALSEASVAGTNGKLRPAVQEVRTAKSEVVPPNTELPTLYQSFIHLSRYSRWLDDKGRRETWEETVTRYMEFMKEHLAVNCNYELPADTYNEVKSYILELKVMPSMRALMTAGEALKRCNSGGYNCSYMAIDTVRAFDEMLYILLNGVGFGFSIERQFINKLPEMAEEFYDTDTTIIVADSKKGWAKAYRELISLLLAGQIPKWDVSKVRPKGARLKTFGGTACLAGDTILYKDRKKPRGYNEITIKELYQLENSLGFWKGKPNHFKQVKIRSLDESTGEFFRNNVITVVNNGECPVYEILTENGYRIKATGNHRFMNEAGEYDYTDNFDIGDLIAVNGSKEKKTGTCKDCGCAISRRSARCRPCFDRSSLKSDALHTTARQRKENRDYRKDYCEACGAKGVKFEVHHIDKAPHNNDHSNLKNLCCACHQGQHVIDRSFSDPYSHRYLSYDKIISITYKGAEEVFDLQMEAPNHNFIANGFVSHNSGPSPLISLFQYTIQAFKDAAGRKLTSFEVHKILCRICDIVAVGGTRRAAAISLSNLSDDRMRHAKSGQWWIASPELALSNNSVAYTEKPDIGIFMEEWLALYNSKSGERGIFNRQAAVKSIEKINERAGFERRSTEEPHGLNPCLSGKTIVAVADGRDNVSIKELADQGVDVPVYCLDDNNKVVIRKMRHPRVTGYNTPVFRLTLDDGSYIDCTENHKFLVRDKGYVELKDLKKDDSLQLMSKYQEKLKKVIYNDDGQSQDYWWINSNEKDASEHRMIAEFHMGAEVLSGNIVHHKDFNALNNHPDNLDVMSRAEHAKLHGQEMLGDKNPMRRGQHEWSKEKWAQYSENMSEAVAGEKNGRFSGVTNEAIREHIVELTMEMGCRVSAQCWRQYASKKSLPQKFSEYRKKYLGTLTALSKWAAKECGFDSSCDPRVYRTYTKLLDQGYDCDIVDGQVFITKECEECSKEFTISSAKREIGLCSHACGIKASQPRRKKFYDARRNALRADQIKVYKNVQSELGREPEKREWLRGCMKNRVSFSLSKTSAFQNWKDLKEGAANYNHRVVSVEYINHQDVYNGTVDDYHNFFVGGFETKTDAGKRKYCYINNLQCGEVILKNAGTCNLSEVIVRAGDTAEDLKSKIRIATILGTWQASLTDFKYVSSKWSKNCKEEALLGVSMTGIMDSPLTNGSKGHKASLPEFLSSLRAHATEVNKEWAEKIGINEAAAITCVKPSGNVSQLTDTASGIHARHSEYYIRNVRLAKNNPVANFMISEGVPNEPDINKPDDHIVFSFPIKSPKGSIIRNDRTAIEQLEFWMIYKDFYCDHNVSCTINVKEHEWFDVGAWVYKHFDRISGLAFIPDADHSYQQPPYQDCTKEEYEAALATMPKHIDETKLSAFETTDNTTSSQQLACSSATGGCEI